MSIMFCRDVFDIGVVCDIVSLDGSEVQGCLHARQCPYEHVSDVH